MKKTKMFLEAVVVIAVVLGLVLPGSAVVTNIEEENSMAIAYGVKADYKFQKAPINNKLPTLFGTDIPAANDALDEHTPDIVKDNDENLWLFYVVKEDVLDSYIYMRKSSDNGDTWPVEDVWYLNSDGTQADPVATIDAHGMLWVAFIDEEIDAIGFLQGQDPSADPTEWEWWQFEQSDNIYYHNMGDVATYQNEGVTVTAWCHIVDIVYPPYSVDEAAVVEHNGDSLQWTYTWDSTWQGKPSTYDTIGSSDDLFFFAFQYTDDISANEVINARWGDAVAQPDMEEWKNEWGMFETDDSYNCKKPSISGSGDNVVLVYQSDEAGNEDIICSYSDDNGDSWTHDIVVVNEAGDEENPRVFVSGVNAYCLYTKDDNLYLIISDNGGATWGDSEQINDEAGSVETQWRTSAINLQNIVWTDDRGDDLDIYFDKFEIGSPPEAPTITGEDDGDHGTAYEYTFSATDPDGDDIAEFLIDWGDETQDTLAGPSPAIMSHTFAIGGTFEITARAKDVNGMVGPEGSLTVKMPRSRTIDLPILMFLQNYPILFKIVQHLLGL